MRHYFVTLTLALLSFLTSAQPLPNAPAAVDQGGTAHSVAAEKLLFFNRPIAEFRGSLMGVSAHDRIARARTRIREQLELPGPQEVTIKTDAMGMLVQIDGATSFVIMATDQDPGREEELHMTAQRAANALSLAIRESRESRNLQSLTQAASIALVATALYSLLVWLAARSRRWLTHRLAAFAEQHTATLPVGGLPLLHRDRATPAIRMILTVLFRVLVLLLTLEWVSFVLRTFPFTRAWGESLNGILLGLAMPILAATIDAIPELLTALLIFYLAFLVTKGFDRFYGSVQTGALPLRWLDADVVVPTQRITKVVVWLFALAMAYPYLPGSNTEAFKGLSVLVGLMLSLGASGLVGQAVSGLILTYGRVFRKGEFVRLADHEGTVTEMGIFTTRIRTGLGEEITLSNASILGSTTKNYSRTVAGSGFVLDTTVTIGYDTPWRQVHALLDEAARRTEGLSQNPPPQVFQTALSDWYPVYRLVCQAAATKPVARALLLSQLHANIQDVFNEYGVQIMSPQYVEDPHQPKRVPPDQWYAAPAIKPDQPPPGGD